MSSEFAVFLDKVSKRYRIFEKPLDRFKYAFTKKEALYKEFWALNELTFNINKGESIGLIGKNGSGKSTLLQMIAGTLTPSTGSIQVNGRIAALLELGSGFNPEFTGRENAIINGTIMGLTIEQAKDRIADIEDFAGIGEFIDQPVKTYSSGMYVRLAFACAVHVDPDILIVDEALAVGDMQFQLKCIEKMKSFKEQGKTIIFVSHDMYSVRNFCETAIWLKDGNIHQRGNVNNVTKEFENYMKDGFTEATNPTQELLVSNNAVLNILNIKTNNELGIETEDFVYGEKIIIQVEYEVKQKCVGLVGGVAIFDPLNTYICGLNTKLDNFSLIEGPGVFLLEIKYTSMKLLPGTYFIDVGFFESSGLIRLDYKSRIKSFHIRSNDYFAEGLVYIEHQWSISSEDQK